MSTIRHWILAIFAILGVFFVAGIVGAIGAAKLSGFWDIPGAGFCAALAVVLSTYIAVPSHRLFSALCVFVLGAVVAWILLEPSSYPDGTRGYQPTHLPVIATYIGGVIGLLIASAHRVLAGPNNSFKPKPLRGSA